MRRVQMAALVAFSVLLGGCTALSTAPTVSPAEREAFTTANRSLPAAVKITENLRSAYLERARSQRRDEKATVIGLIGMGILTANMAARGVGESAVLGLGMAGAGGYAASGYLNTRGDRFTFLQGAAALQCALDATQPLQLAYLRKQDLSKGIGDMEAGVQLLEAGLVGLETNFSIKAVEARNAVAKAKALLPAARDANSRLELAGGDLFTTVGHIEVEVEKALESGTPDFKVFIGSLIQSKIISAPSFVDRADPTKTSDRAQLLVAPTTKLLTDMEQVQKIVDLVNTRPSVSSLQNCKVDIAAIGVSMKVEPAILTVAAGTVRSVLANGGVGSYQAAWLGASPPADQVAIRSEGNGVVLVEAKQNAQAGTYTLMVSDSAKGRETVAVTFTAGEAAKAGGTSSATTKPVACTKDPIVEKVQKKLNEINESLPADKKAAALDEDGCLGTKTIAAMTKWQLDQGVDKDAIQKDEKKLLGDMVTALGIK